MAICTRRFFRRVHHSSPLLALLAALLVVPSFAQQLQPIPLPKPQITGGMPLMQALAQRHTTRVFDDKDLPIQTLSNLLWAAFGVNRPRATMPTLGRTAPSGMNSQDVELDVILPAGVYVYDAEQNLLRPIATGDLRAAMLTAPQAHAPVTILYTTDAKATFAQVDNGFIGQNVYLFAASEGLNAWFYTVRADRITAALKLPATRLPLYAQSVGYPPAPSK
jgi:nitroreductase